MLVEMPRLDGSAIGSYGFPFGSSSATFPERSSWFGGLSRALSLFGASLVHKCQSETLELSNAIRTPDFGRGYARSALPNKTYP